MCPVTKVVKVGIERIFMANKSKTPIINFISDHPECLEVLSERERKIIKLRFAFNAEGYSTLSEVGNLLGITRERVRQIEEKCIEKIKQYKGKT